MKIHRIYAIYLRYFFLFRKSVEKISEVFYWTLIDVLLWGLTAKYFESDPQSNVLKLILSGIIFWGFVQRSQFEVNINILEELWNKNLINLFVSPITFWEWISGILSISVFKVFLNFLAGTIIILLVYRINIFDFGLYIIPFAFLLTLSGWIVSFFIGALLLTYGTKIQSFGWSIIFLFAPFSGIYYPIETLPIWAQTLSKFIPMSYIFDGIRKVVETNNFDIRNIVMCVLISFVYLVIGMYLLRKSFNRLLLRGMVNLQ